MLDDFLRIQDVINNYNNIISNYKSRGYSTTLVNITTLGDKAADDYISFQDMTTLLNNISNDTQGISTDYFNLIFPTLDEEIDNIYKVNGIMHLFAISGMHISLLSSLLLISVCTSRVEK